jgi:hypothetical protein
MHANIDNLKYYNILKYLLINQKEPKLNLLKYFSQNFNKHIEHNESVNVKNISFYKKHLISNIISKSNINKIKIVSNMFLYLEKKIAQPFINSMNNSIDNMYIDDNGAYFVLEYDRFFCCYAEIYLMSLSLWQHIRRKLYEFYELHMVAYKIHINNLIKYEYGYEIYLRDNYNINDDIFDYNLEKIKRDEFLISKPGTNQEEGTGLGLVLCKEFILLNNGELLVQNNNDGGAEIILILPGAQ